MKARANQASIALLLLGVAACQGAPDQITNLRAGIQAIRALIQQSRVAAAQQSRQLWHDLQILTQSQHLARDRRALANAPGDALHIPQALQRDRKAAAQGGTLVKLLNALQARIQFRQIEQRTRQGAAQEAGTHWSNRAVQHTEQAALNRLPARALQKVQVALRMSIQHHIACRLIRTQTSQQGEQADIHLLQISDDSPGSRD